MDEDAAYRIERAPRSDLGIAALAVFGIFNGWAVLRAGWLLWTAGELAGRQRGVGRAVVQTVASSYIVDHLAIWAIGGVGLRDAPRPCRRAQPEAAPHRADAGQRPWRPVTAAGARTPAHEPRRRLPPLGRRRG